MALVLRAMVVLLLIGSAARAAEPWPGVWLEAEAASISRARRDKADSASNKELMSLDGPGQFVGWPIDLPKPLASGRLFVRYVRHVPEAGRLRVAIGPADTRAIDGAGVRVLKDVELSSTMQWPVHRWAVVPIGELPSGKHVLLLQSTVAKQLSLDFVGLLDAAEAHSWSPPVKVDQGKFVDAPRAAQPLLTAELRLDAPIHLLAGEQVLGPGGKPVTLTARLTNLANQPTPPDVQLQLVDAAGQVVLTQTVAGQPLAVDEQREIAIAFTPPGYGWFSATVGAQGAASVESLAFGVLRKPVEGLRPQSIFGLNIAYRPQDLLAARMMGLKWRRGIPHHFEPNNVAPRPGEWWTQAEIDKRREAIKAWREAGIHTLGLINYNTDWNVAPGIDGKKPERWRNRPKDLKAQADITYHSIKPLADLVDNWEIWNEPWVAGWTWQTGTAQDYREMSRLIWERLKPELPQVMLIGGGSTSYQRDILFAPGNPDIGYADGCSTHPYNSPDRTMPSSAAVESVLLKKYSRSGGKAGIWATEVGAPEYSLVKDPPADRPFVAARTVAPLYLLNLLGAGDTPIRIFYFTSNWGEPFANSAHNIWDGQNPKPSVVAFSAMTHFLEDGKLQGDLFARSTAVFAPHFVKPDGSSVVAFWADDGYSGTIHLPGGVFEAFDYLGAPVGKSVDGKLAIDFVRWGVVYLTSRQTPEQVRSAMLSADFRGMPAVRVNPRSFTAPLSSKPALRMKVENLLPRAIDARLNVPNLPDIELASNSVAIDELQPGEVRFIELPVQKATTNPANRYPISYTLRVGDQEQKGEQTVQAAVATFGSATIDGKLDEWKDAVPVSVLSRGGKDFLEIALNPDKAAALLNARQPGDTVAYKVWTRWDDRHFYLAAEVPDEKPARKPPASADPTAFAFNVDCLQFAFDCLEPNPDDFFVHHPLREKFFGSEVDYEFSAALAANNTPEVHRLKAPGTNYQTIYATNVPTNPPLGLMPSARVAIMYDESAKVYRYEIALPWEHVKELGEQLEKLEPGQSVSSRFAFGITDTAGRGSTFWTQEAGDLQSGAYGFTPTWTGGSTRHGGRVLTDWGFVR